MTPNSILTTETETEFNNKIHIAEAALKTLDRFASGVTLLEEVFNLAIDGESDQTSLEVGTRLHTVYMSAGGKSVREDDVASAGIYTQKALTILEKLNLAGLFDLNNNENKRIYIETLIYSGYIDQARQLIEIAVEEPVTATEMGNYLCMLAACSIDTGNYGLAYEQVTHGIKLLEETKEPPTETTSEALAFGYMVKATILREIGSIRNSAAILASARSIIKDYNLPHLQTILLDMLWDRDGFNILRSICGGLVDARRHLRHELIDASTRAES